jgi:hypothetical protein
MMAGSAYLNPASDDLITETLLSSSTALVTFDVSSLAAAGYKHLQLRITGQRATTGGNTLSMQLNSDTGSNYTFHRLESDGSSVYTNAGTARTNMAVGQIVGNNMQWTAYICDILDFASASKNTTIRALTGYAGGHNIGLYSGAWLNTAAVTSIKLFVEAGTNFSSGSRFSLYASKG